MFFKKGKTHRISVLGKVKKHSEIRDFNVFPLSFTAGGRPWCGGRHPGIPSGFETRYRAALAAREEPIPKDEDGDYYECWVPCAPSLQGLIECLSFLT